MFQAMLDKSFEHSILFGQIVCVLLKTFLTFVQGNLINFQYYHIVIPLYTAYHDPNTNWQYNETGGITKFEQRRL